MKQRMKHIQLKLCGCSGLDFSPRNDDWSCPEQIGGGVIVRLKLLISLSTAAPKERHEVLKISRCITGGLVRAPQVLGY